MIASRVRDEATFAGSPCGCMQLHLFHALTGPVPLIIICEWL